MAPLHRNSQWSLAPLRDRKSNGSIVILLKSKEFGPPRIEVGCGFGPPYAWKNTIYRTRKRSMTKKRSSEIFGDRWNFGGKCRNFFGKLLKKIVHKYPPPVSEVLDPLVHIAYPVSTGIFPHSLPEWAFRARPGLWRICLCPKVARIAR